MVRIGRSRMCGGVAILHRFVLSVYLYYLRRYVIYYLFIKQTSEVVEIYRRHRHLLCTAVVNTVYPITSKWTVYFYFYLMASRLHLLFYLRVNIK